MPTFFIVFVKNVNPEKNLKLQTSNLKNNYYLCTRLTKMMAG